MQAAAGTPNSRSKFGRESTISGSHPQYSRPAAARASPPKQISHPQRWEAGRCPRPAGGKAFGADGQPSSNGSRRDVLTGWVLV
ncbi:hypothetical protein GGTG_07799 [Gaeumannomyces tritici R3-111a-1]|uniref:Uncharacterized protein n=1 Tax=Gaeumannomyces tritici (strain R3-111a-1) TaxID=644352 RepID=J3P2Q4_GAET3|nr:hypothetical protein GGTG_07799 [Gaeumannomyces tritici R3-111a-1]EJT73946.1 hypothetical protein GGTG_07799 [Gaeumannomyces tritici R3-111a-1]